MLVIGINDTHDASACLIKDGQIIDVVLEERLSRKKGISSLPVKSIRYILKKNKIKSKDIDHISVANQNLNHMNLWNINCDFKIFDWLKLQEKYYYETIFKKRKKKLRNIFPKYKPSCSLGYSLKKIPFISSDEATEKHYKIINKVRINTICKLFKVSPNKISFHDHHKCHAFYGYFTNPKKNKLTAVVTADGGGDGAYNSVSIFKNGQYKLLIKSKNNWIGKAYTAVTLMLGLNPFRHHYKVMGLAPYSNKKHYKNILNFFLNFLKPKGIDFKLNSNVTDTFFYFKKNLEGYRFDNLAGALQEFVELRLVQWFKNISKKCKTNNFVFSGGVANNVKANKVLSEQNFIKSLWIPPGPGDESLSVGAVYAYLYDVFGPDKLKKYIKNPLNAYWGPSILESEIEIFKKNKFVRKNFIFKKDNQFKKVAKLLSKGEIVFICIGKQEFGPRALGHRSIICDPSKLELVKKINSTIKMRDFWMPFTPSILNSFAKKYIRVSNKLDLKYMTSCVEATELGKKHLSAAIHQSDYTVRPQLVSETTCSKYFQIIKNFSKTSGIGAVLNTSLNMHEYPIVTNPMNILNEIIKKNEDINFNILIENNLFIRKFEKEKNYNS